MRGPIGHLCSALCITATGPAPHMPAGFAWRPGHVTLEKLCFQRSSPKQRDATKIVRDGGVFLLLSCFSFLFFVSFFPSDLMYFGWNVSTRAQFSTDRSLNPSESDVRMRSDGHCV